MGNLTVFESIIGSKLNSLHTSFLAKVITFKGDSADIQPLWIEAPILPNTPITQNAKYRIVEQEISIDGYSFTNLVKTPLIAGDIVICVCCERNISSAKKGEMPSITEPTQKHSLSNSVIVGFI